MQSFLQQIWIKLLDPRSLRFIAVGIIGALTNILILIALVDSLLWHTTLERSLANLITTEICLYEFVSTNYIFTSS